MSNLPTLVQTLQMAIKALTMYTEQHPRSQEAVQALATQLEAWLAKQPQLHLAASSGRLFVDGAPVESMTVHMNALQKQLSERQISGFIIQRGVQPDELLAMLRLLILKPSRLEEQGGVTRVLATMNLRHISLSQTQYREVREGEGAGEATQPSPAVNSAVLNELQRWQEALKAILEARQGKAPDLSPLTPVALDLGWGEAPPTPAQVEPLRSAITGFPGDDQLAFLAGLDHAPTRPTSLNLATRMLAPEVLGRLTGHLMGTGKAAHLEPLARLLAEDPSRWPASLLEHFKEGMGGLQTWLDRMDWSQQTFEEKLRRAAEEDALWNLSLEERLAFLREVLTQGHLETFLRLLDQVVQRLQREDPAAREAAALTAAGIATWVKSPGLPPEAEGVLIDGLMAHFGWEPVSNIHRATERALATLLATFVERGELGFTLALLRDLDGLCAFLEANQSWKREALESLRTALATPSSLQSVVEACQRTEAPCPIQEILPFLEALGEPAARSLTELLANEPDRRRRGVLMDFLRAMGSTTVPALQRSLNAPEWYVVRNALNLLAELGDASLLDSLKPSLNHEDGRVRRAAVRALWKLGGPASVPTLSAFLPRTDPETQMEILFGLGQVHHPSASQAVADLARREQVPLPLRIRATEVLGQLGDPSSALPVLAELLKRKGRIFTSSEPPELRMAAARALVNLGSPESLAILRSVANEEPRGGQRDAFLALLPS